MSKNQTAWAEDSGTELDGVIQAESAGGSRISDVGAPTAANDATTKTYVDTADATKLSKAGDVMTGSLGLGGNALYNIAEPGDVDHAATKQYVDNKILSSTPANASDTGTAGQIKWDSSYIYVCIAANTWKRVAISTW